MTETRVFIPSILTLSVDKDRGTGFFLVASCCSGCRCGAKPILRIRLLEEGDKSVVPVDGLR